MRKAERERKRVVAHSIEGKYVRTVLGYCLRKHIRTSLPSFSRGTKEGCVGVGVFFTVNEDKAYKTDLTARQLS